MFVPVVNMNNEPLMPTTPSRARRWIKSGKATPFWKKGIFCVRLNIKTQEHKQDIVVGIDPGSKKEGFTVKSHAHTFVNIQTDAVTWVKDNVETRSNARRSKRQRKTPCRQPRWNRRSLRKKSRIPPSTRARWQWKLRVLNWLEKLFPITFVIVEDIKAVTKGQRKWDASFSPLEQGKRWFYSQIKHYVITKEGWETKQLRDSANLKKSKNKMSSDFSAHCVDSWVLANSVVGGHNKPDNTEVMCIRPLRFYRRQLHMFCPAKGGKRRRHGGTISMGLKRGSFVKHEKYGICYVGGTMNNRISLNNMNGERLSQSVKVTDCKFLCYSSFVSI
jgi:RRXRR protein